MHQINALHGTTTQMSPSWLLSTHWYELSYRPTRLQKAITACPSQCGPRMSAVICPGFIQGRDRAIKVGVLDPKRICGSCGLCASNSFSSEADALLEGDMKAQSAPFLSQTLPVKQKRLSSGCSPAPHCSTAESRHFSLTWCRSTPGSLACLWKASSICAEAGVKKGKKKKD